MEKIIENEVVRRFVTIDEFLFDNGSGSGEGYGNGDGSGNGHSDGYGEGYGNGDGSGDGPGDGFDDGSGYGDGPGDGFDDGSGYGDGDGDGYGDGDGDGYGDGDGDGYGDSNGSGDGSGYGSGIDIKYLNGQKVYRIDGIATLIDFTYGTYAKGRILDNNLTTKDCFIVKQGNYFAHGETLKQALNDAMEKFTKNQPIGQRIAQFNAKFPDRGKKVAASELFSWHHILTGSCLMGRKQFCEERGLDYENGEYTVNEFISLTKDAYGNEVIRQLEETK